MLGNPQPRHGLFTGGITTERRMSGSSDKSDVNTNGRQRQSQGRFTGQPRTHDAARPTEAGSNVEPTSDVGAERAAPHRSHRPPAQQTPRR